MILSSQRIKTLAAASEKFLEQPAVILFIFYPGKRFSCETRIITKLAGYQ